MPFQFWGPATTTLRSNVDNMSVRLATKVTTQIHEDRPGSKAQVTLPGNAFPFWLPACGPSCASSASPLLYNVCLLPFFLRPKCEIGDVGHVYTNEWKRLPGPVAGPSAAHLDRTLEKAAKPSEPLSRGVVARRRKNLDLAGCPALGGTTERGAMASAGPKRKCSPKNAPQEAAARPEKRRFGGRRQGQSRAHFGARIPAAIWRPESGRQ